MPTKRVIATAAVLLFTLLCAKKPTPSVVVGPEVTVPVTGVSATFVPADDKVLVSWTAVGTSVLGYRIFSAWGATVLDEDYTPADTIVPATATSFLALPGVGDGIYHYKVAAVWHQPYGSTGLDTVQGQLSADDTAFVSTVVSGGSIRINDGAAYTATTVVNISLVPPENFLSFQVLDTLGTQWLTHNVGGTQVVTPTPHTEVAINPSVNLNPIATVQLGQGNGTKEVYVRAKKTDGTQITLKSFIKIQPYVCKLVLRNSDLRKGNTTPGRFTSQKNLKFSVQIYGDTTFSSACSVWVATNGNGKGQMDTLGTDWFETRPLEYLLSSNEDSVYEYDVNDANLSKLVHTVTATKSANRRAGAWYGGKDSAFTLSSKGYDKGSIFYLSNTGSSDQLYSLGYKEFFLLAKLKGKHFNDDRFVWSRVTANTLYKWDLYPPQAYIQPNILSSPNPTPAPGDTVLGPIDVLLSTAGSVRDMGASLPVEAKLYFAQTTKDAADITLADILASRHVVYTKTFNTTDYTVKNVGWIGMIDPTQKDSEWISGKYVMAITTSDNYGNSGIAPAEQNKLGFNPRIIYIQTGK